MELGKWWKKSFSRNQFCQKDLLDTYKVVLMNRPFFFAGSLKISSSKSENEGKLIFLRNAFLPSKFSFGPVVGSFGKPAEKSSPNIQNVFAESPKRKKLINTSKNIVLQWDLLETRDLVLTTLPKGLHNIFFAWSPWIWRPNSKQKLLPKHTFEHVKRFPDFSNKILFAKSPKRLALSPEKPRKYTTFQEKNFLELIDCWGLCWKLSRKKLKPSHLNSRKIMSIFLLKFLFPAIFLLLDTWKEVLTSMTEYPTGSPWFFCWKTKSDEKKLFSQQKFCQKVPLDTYKTKLMNLPTFFPKEQESVAQNQKLIEKTNNCRSNFFPPNVSHKPVEGSFDKQRKISPNIRDLFADGPKVKKLEKISKNVFLLKDLLHMQDSFFHNPTKKFSAVHPLSYVLKSVSVNRSFQTEVPSKISSSAWEMNLWKSCLKLFA